MTVKIFVSYRHADMEPRPGFKDSRVGHILRDIKFDIRAADPRSGISIVRDKEGMLNAGDDIYETVNEAIDSSDIGLLLLSEAYCDSENCIDEFRRFMDLDKPIFIVETDDAWRNLPDDHPLSSLREDAASILSAQFWGVEDGNVAIYGWPLPHKDKKKRRRRYYEALHVLTTGIKTRVAEFKTAVQPAPADDDRVAVFAHPNSGCNVLIAYPTPDVSAEASRLERELEQKDYLVRRFNYRKDYADASQFGTDISHALEQADLFIQLVGALPGRSIVAGDSRRLVTAQFKAAAEANTRMLLWKSPEFDVNDCDEDHGEFVRKLEAHDTDIESFIRYAINEVQQTVDRNTAQAAEPAMPAMMDGGNAMQFVAIDADESDAEEAEALQELLQEYVVVNRVPTYFDDSDVLAAATRDRDGIIFVYGKTAQSQKRALSHMPFVLRRSLGRGKFAIGDSHPKPSAAQSCPTGPGMKIIRVEFPDGGGKPFIDEQQLLSFLTSLGVTPSNSAFQNATNSPHGTG